MVEMGTVEMGESGYSGTPLVRKLGMRGGQSALLLGVPDDLTDIAGFPGFSRCETAVDGPASRRHDYIHVFAVERAKLEALALPLAASLKADGMMWISWPKRASKVPTTLTEDVLREIFLPLGLVDTKVCAVDAVWSGLKFMFRKDVRADL
ncbi:MULTISPECIES: hypothetical protein [Ensifer]|jgi:hypothetical protein|nr:MULTISPECIES: hypothetical protein [Ensifer]AHK45028.1 hypothetical protein OV14_3777 [Ensifer adhaerens OV14]MDP9630281.1 hypothetical protein [Ensifer adhaerens]KQU85771.1 hypothetical protein ASD00_31720 [Ensifer sp. Root31]KQW83292.1 hypothetical protein ASD03_21595 [Ensifer sp. Root127]KQY68802.1 hypothetical protein ASD52_32925 [Ensifer sp. Root142]